MLPLAHIGFTSAAVRVLEKGLRLRAIDYRILIIASLLPDLIDKPLAKMFKSSITTYESRAFGHSLMFLGLIAVCMMLQRLWGDKFSLFPVFCGVLLHDVFDVMWLHQEIFLWPFYGWDFTKPENEAWTGFIQLNGYKIKQLDFFDNISVLILLWFFMKLALGGKLVEFMRKGHL